LEKPSGAVGGGVAGSSSEEIKFPMRKHKSFYEEENKSSSSSSNSNSSSSRSGETEDDVKESK